MLHAEDKKNWSSPNFNNRRGHTPDMIILHYTGMKTAQAALERLCDPSTEVSAHYCIEDNGKLHQLVPDEKRAWHAGVSSWEGQTDINSRSIGIELVNPGHEFGYTKFPEAQIDTLEVLLEKLCMKFSIKPANIIGHSDIAPERKIDPGELFPWKRLADNGYGLWPIHTQEDKKHAASILSDLSEIQTLFTHFGYNPNLDLEILIHSFHRHFYPEKFKAEIQRKSVDVDTIARLLSLIRQKFE